MGAKSKTAEAERTRTKRVLPSLVVVLLLSLATWFFFQLESMRLDGPATTVVVGVWFLIVILVRTIWQHFRKKGS
jgi:protein-S-isoprenylcysteine O-methyltransferase Ste14